MYINSKYDYKSVEIIINASSDDWNSTIALICLHERLFLHYYIYIL